MIKKFAGCLLRDDIPFSIEDKRVRIKKLELTIEERDDCLYIMPMIKAVAFSDYTQVERNTFEFQIISPDDDYKLFRLLEDIQLEFRKLQDFRSLFNSLGRDN